LSGAGPVALERVSVPKASDILATQLRSRIRSGELAEGAALPAERELALQTGLSRVSVREALRILEIEGLIAIRTGRAGGAKVRRPGRDELSRHLELFIWGRNVAYEQLHEVREALEALAAEGAARRRTEADIAYLHERTRALEAALDDHGRYLAANLEWHMAVARASHNDLLIGFMNVLSGVIDKATAIEAFDSPGVRAATLRIHQRILTAIVERDAETARRRMLRHVVAARELALDDRRR
jgi:DNA-binding FadR family transcriptional regulator